MLQAPKIIDQLSAFIKEGQQGDSTAVALSFYDNAEGTRSYVAYRIIDAQGTSATFGKILKTNYAAIDATANTVSVLINNSYTTNVFQIQIMTFNAEGIALNSATDFELEHILTQIEDKQKTDWSPIVTRNRLSSEPTWLWLFNNNSINKQDTVNLIPSQNIALFGKMSQSDGDELLWYTIKLGDSIKVDKVYPTVKNEISYLFKNDFLDIFEEKILNISGQTRLGRTFNRDILKLSVEVNYNERQELGTRSGELQPIPCTVTISSTDTNSSSNSGTLNSSITLDLTEFTSFPINVDEYLQPDAELYEIFWQIAPKTNVLSYLKNSDNFELWQERNKKKILNIKYKDFTAINNQNFKAGDQLRLSFKPNIVSLNQLITDIKKICTGSYTQNMSLDNIIYQITTTYNSIIVEGEKLTINCSFAQTDGSMPPASFTQRKQKMAALYFLHPAASVGFYKRFGIQSTVYSSNYFNANLIELNPAFLSQGDPQYEVEIQRLVDNMPMETIYTNSVNATDTVFIEDRGVDFSRAQQYRIIISGKKNSKIYRAIDIIAVTSNSTALQQDITLMDMHNILHIKYNSEIGGLKYNTQDSIINTLGNKYPYVRRNGNTYYRTFNINGLISYNSEVEEVGELIPSTSLNFVPTCGGMPIPTFAYSSMFGDMWDHDLDYIASPIDREIILERIFRERVIEFLQNDKVKLFKSLTEGSMLIRLINVQLTPNQQLGRMIYSFSAQAIEVAAATEENLKKYQISREMNQDIFNNERLLWTTEGV